MLYLFCHAVAKPKDPADSHLILSGDEAVTLGQLRVFAPAEDLLASHPLVFINACESGELSPNFYDGFVSYFLSKGARGVIGTECKAPGYFASEWAKAFFDELFAGKTLGAVVLELRRQVPGRAQQSVRPAVRRALRRRHGRRPRPAAGALIRPSDSKGVHRVTATHSRQLSAVPLDRV